MSKKILVKILSDIENRKAEMLTVNKLAKENHFSASHLQRLFRFTTGKSLMTYSRGRKLAHSLQDIYHSDLRIFDIALNYGFQHEQSFSRAFLKEFGCSPGLAREKRKVLAICEKINPDSIRDLGQGILCEQKVVIVPTFCVIGKPRYFEEFIDERDAYLPSIYGMQFYFEEAPRIRNAVYQDVYIGIVNNLKDNSVIYMPSLQVKNLSQVPEGFEGKKIEGGLFVKFRYVGQHHYSEINVITAKSIYIAVEDFFAGQTRYCLDPLKCFFERITTNDDETICQMDLVIPVTDRLTPIVI